MRRPRGIKKNVVDKLWSTISVGLSLLFNGGSCGHFQEHQANVSELRLFSCDRVNKLLPEVTRKTAIALMVG